MRSRRTVPWWMAVLIVGAVLVMVFVPEPAHQVESLGTRILTPVQFGVSSLVDQADQVSTVVQRIGDLARQNDQYREEIDRLQTEIVRLHELEVENRDLRNLLGLKQQAGTGELLPVRVIARDPSPYLKSVTIDRGTDDNVRDGMTVITWRGVVGRITRASATSSRVLLITDINSSISGRIQTSESRVTGIIRGRPEGGLLMQHIPQEETLQTGETVVTSDLGGIVPEGLVVGQVVQVRRKDVDVFQEAIVEPAADMKQLERLYILMGSTSTRGDGAR
jgi:rod shape-determining protein MreC